MTKLADLLTGYRCDECPDPIGGHTRQATIDDLRSVLADPEVQEMLGARTVELLGGPSDPDDFIEDGNYLVVPLSRLEDPQ